MGTGQGFRNGGYPANLAGQTAGYFRVFLSNQDFNALGMLAILLSFRRTGVIVCKMFTQAKSLWHATVVLKKQEFI